MTDNTGLIVLAAVIILLAIAIAAYVFMHSGGSQLGSHGPTTIPSGYNASGYNKSAINQSGYNTTGYNSSVPKANPYP